uniref:Pachytene checkpoint protein 2 homolog n=2 Tax=Cacopsylla melanoneura TaxID=428564 RepID=A0A8D8U8B3_9HEMI
MKTMKMQPVLNVEVMKHLTSKCKTEDLRTHVLSYLKANANDLFIGQSILEFPNNVTLHDNVRQIDVCELADGDLAELRNVSNNKCKLESLDQFKVHIHIYMLDPSGLQPEDIDNGSGEPSEITCSSNRCALPSEEFHGLWDSLVFDDNIKQMLLQYAETSMKFSYSKVNSNIISWNRVILLHGPPGTGKTSLCKAVAQKLSIRLRNKYKVAEFIEINSHSLFSKYFSESGKLVQKMFSKIREAVEYEDALVCLLIDEIESLTRAREAVLSGTEPSDGVRVVNAVLTQIDQLKRYPNVLIFTTSNLTGAIDLAFVDRADIKHYIGYPSQTAIFKIFSSCLDELKKSGLVVSDMSCDEQNERLMQACKSCAGVSGRTLRKIPFLTFVKYIPNNAVTIDVFVSALEKTVKDVLVEQKNLITKRTTNGHTEEMMDQ